MKLFLSLAVALFSTNSNAVDYTPVVAPPTAAEKEAAEINRNQVVDSTAITNNNTASTETGNQAAKNAAQVGDNAAKKQSNNSMIYTGISTVAMAAFTASCSGAGATCNYAFLAVGVAFSVFSGVAGKNASKAASAADSARWADYKTTGLADSVAPETSALSSCTTTECIYKNSTNSAMAKRALSDLQKLRDAGVKTNADGSVTAKNLTLSPTDLKDDASMKAAGLSEAAINDIKSKLSEANALAAKLSSDDDKKLAATKGGGANLTSALGGDGSSDGSGGKFGTGPNRGSSNGEGLANGLGAGGAAGKPGRSPSNVAGMAKNIGGALLGVAEDKIFGMMNRRYEKQDREGTFLSKKVPN